MNCARSRVSTLALACIFLSAGLLTQSGCYLSSSGKEMEQRVQKVEEQQAEFMSTFARTRDELTELVSQAEQQVSSLRETLEEARNLLGSSSATLGVRVDELERQLAGFQGQLDSAEFNTDEVRQELRVLETDIEFRLEQLER